MSSSEGAAEGVEKEKREHRPTRKAALNMEASKEQMTEMAAKDAEKAKDPEKEKKEVKGKAKGSKVRPRVNGKAQGYKAEAQR